MIKAKQNVALYRKMTPLHTMLDGLSGKHVVFREMNVDLFSYSARIAGPPLPSLITKNLTNANKLFFTSQAIHMHFIFKI